uniref:Uncharacterized protein n=1 Tax=Oryza punctata TaxID=4537 RepID=A0A0E0KAV8_ORYPU
MTTGKEKVERRNGGGSWRKRDGGENLPSRRLRSLRRDESRLNRGGAPISIQRAEQGRDPEPSFAKDISNPEGLLWGVLHRASTVKAGQEDNQSAHNSSRRNF